MSGTVAELNSDGTSIRRLIPKRDQDNNFNYIDKYKTVNVYFFKRDFFKKNFKPVINMYVRANEKEYWELVLGALIYLKIPNIVPYIIPDDEKWFEVDDKSDLEVASKLFSTSRMA